MPPISDIKGVLSRGDSERREEKRRRLSDLFVERSAILAEPHIAVFDEVIQRLSHGIGFRVRVELAEKLCRIASAPAGSATSSRC